MTEIKINESMSLYYRDLKNGGSMESEYLIELHDFENLCMYREVVDKCEIDKIIENKACIFNYFELV